jgi:outer membrane lipoprotein-sorting protein
MKTRALTLALLTSSCLLTTAQVQNDKQADEILKAVSAKYKSFASVKASFTIILESGKDSTRESQSGTIYIKGDKYKLEIKGQDILSDGKTVWTVLKDAKEIQINETSKEDESINPSTIFTIYEKDYNYKFIEEKTENGKQVQVVELVPIDKTKKVFKIRMTIDKNDKLVISTKVFQKNGNRTTYSIKNFTPNPPVDDNFFLFKKESYPGYEIIDLR